MALNTNDRQIAGVLDDGTNEGVIRAKIVTGDLVKIPMASLDYSTVLSGTGAAITDLYNIFTNGDGTGQIVNMSTVAGLTNGCALRTTIFGRVVGIRYRRNSQTPPFSVWIDGVPRDIPTISLAPRFTNVAGPADREGLFIIADDLPDTAHSVEVILFPDATVAKTLILYGFLGEARAGYAPATRLDVAFAQGVLTNVSAPISFSASVRGFKSVFYQNTDLANPHRVTLRNNSLVVWSEMIPADKTIRVVVSEIGTALSGNSTTWSHFADAGSVINYSCFGNG
ncbi:hypothetical protein [Dyadobacter sp. OTU695]|uniref:hypothetical protein n=1 Tax=Dyadobacter sp. OTU695 TaxID=3043860 RepID=UPI00313C0749